MPTEPPRVCAHCVERPAVAFWGRYKLCKRCWQFVQRHGRLPTAREGDFEDVGLGRLGGIGVRGNEKPRLDEIERKLK